MRLRTPAGFDNREFFRELVAAGVAVAIITDTGDNLDVLGEAGAELSVGDQAAVTAALAAHGGRPDLATRRARGRAELGV